MLCSVLALAKVVIAGLSVTPHNKRFIGKEESTRVTACRVISSIKLNRVQSLYRVSWGTELARVAWYWWSFVV